MEHTSLSPLSASPAPSLSASDAFGTTTSNTSDDTLGQSPHRTAPLGGSTVNDDSARLFKLRKHRFRAQPTAITSVTSTARTPTADAPLSPSSATQTSPSMASHYESSPERPRVARQSQDGPILSDISNANFRRKARLPADDQRKENSKFGTRPDRPATSSPTSPRPGLPRSLRGTPSRRVISSGETSKYIEHLESQLVSLQTQLSGLTSPSSTKTQSAKLRAMNSETKMLRQELTEWEGKFHERLSDQISEHKRTVDGLQNQINALEKDGEVASTRLQTLEVELQDKATKLTAVEGANYDLERRLEFMSELLATSPTKIDLHHDALDRAGRRPPRPKSMGPPRLPSLNALFSPRSQSNTSPGRRPQMSPETPSPHVPSHTFDGFPFEPPMTSDKRVSRPESVSDLSETATLVNPLDSPYSRDARILQQIQANREGGIRPVRRMRRFYAGSMGPRSLILPTTTNAVSNSPSTPSQTTPKPSEHNLLALDALGISSVESGASNDTPVMGRGLSNSRSGHNTGQHARQRSSLSSINMPGDRSSFYSAVTASNRNSVIITPLDQPSLLPPFEVNEMDNLFDELNRAQQDSSGDEAEGTSSRLLSLSSAVPFDEKASEPSQDALSLVSIKEQLQAPTLEQHPSIGAEHEKPNTASQQGEIVVPPKTLASHMLAQEKEVPNEQTRSARTIFTNAWTKTVFSRPVLALRWWLVRLLLGDLRRKAFICAGACAQKKGVLPDLNVDPALTTSSTTTAAPESESADPCNPGSRSREGSPSEERARAMASVARTFTRLHARTSSRQQHEVGLSPAASWLKFSMTLLFAVGLAIKEGPNALYAPPNG